jgi:hypothetical protein
MRSFLTTTIAGQVAVANTSQKIADHNPKRDLLMLLNPTGETGALFYNFGADAASNGTTESGAG